jgi:hypothetical protein
VHFPLQVPAAAGRHVLKIDLVEQGVTLFEAAGAPPLAIAFETAAVTPTPSAQLYEYAAGTNPWHYRPTRGIQYSADGGTYPLFAARGDGCHLWDLEGRRYIDYVMGWGTALLGYNEPRVREAMIAAMDTGPVLPLAHPVELDVTRILIEDIPCAEMAVFGKHGSDACTVAARLARAFTGRSTILYCGYHGWQDWWVEQAGFARSGVPERPRPLIHRFRFNDLADFTRLFDGHRADLAAVMLEPSGPAEGMFGPFEDTDRAVLAAIAAMTREAGAVLVYDEILTGFRYPGGSVQGRRTDRGTPGASSRGRTCSGRGSRDQNTGTPIDGRCRARGTERACGEGPRHSPASAPSNRRPAGGGSARRAWPDGARAGLRTPARSGRHRRDPAKSPGPPRSATR